MLMLQAADSFAIARIYMSTPESLQRIDEICDDFERNWSSTLIANQAKLLDQVPAELRSELLTHLLRVDLDLRAERNIMPTLAEYKELVPFNDPLVEAEYVAMLNRLGTDDTSRSPEELAPTRRLDGTNPSPVFDSQLMPSIRLGKYEVEAKLGSGGFGTVYRAVELATQRRVAIKVPNSTNCDVELFIKEAVAVSKLEHPNICKLYFVEDDPHQPYIVYRYVQGPTLAERIKAGPFTVTESVSLMQSLCDAFSYAHRMKIIHRDIKPGNILLDESRKPIVVDFGLAKVYTPDASTQSSLGTAVGTIHYIAPEQLLGKDATEQTDVFSLGVVFYELLTGKRPFVGSSIGAISGQILNAEPEPPSRLNPETTEAIDSICLKALAKLPRDRYQSMEQFAEALAAARLRTKPQTEARGEPKRSRILGLGAGVLLLSLATAAAIIYRIQTDQGMLIVQSDDPSVKLVVSKDGNIVTILDTITESKVKLKSGQYSLSLRGDLNKVQLSNSEVTISRSGKKIVTVKRQTPEAIALSDTASGPEKGAIKPVASAGQRDRNQTTNPHGAPLWTSTKCPGDFHLVYDDFVISDSTKFGRLRWEGAIISKQNMRNPSLDLQMWKLEIHEDYERRPGQLIASRTIATKNVKHTELASRQVGDEQWVTYLFEHDLRDSVGLKPGRYWCSLYACYDSVEAKFSWAVSEGGIGDQCLQKLSSRPVYTMQAGDRAFEFLAEHTQPEQANAVIMPDQARIIESYDLGNVRDSETAKLRAKLVNAVRTQPATEVGKKRFHKIQQSPWPVDFCEQAAIPNNELLAAGGGDASKAPRELVSVIGNSRWKCWAEPTGLDVSAINNTAITATLDDISVWDTVTGNLRQRFIIDELVVNSVALNQQANTVLAALSDHSLRLIDVTNGKTKATFFGHTDRVQATVFANDDNLIFSASLDKSIRVWDANSGACLRTLPVNSGVNAIALDSSQAVIAAACVDGKIRAWDAERFEPISVLDFGDGEAVSVDFSSDGKRLAACNREGQISVWSRDEEFRIESQFKSAILPAYRVCFSDDASLLAVASRWECNLWNLETKAIASSHQTHADAKHLVWAKDRWLVGWSSGWISSLDKIGNSTNLDAAYISAAALSPDGTTLGVTVRDRQEVELWALMKQPMPRVIPGDAKWDNAIGFTSDGMSCITAGGIWKPKFWSLDQGHQPNRFGGHNQWIVGIDMGSDGKCFCTYGYDNALKTWDIESGDLLQTMVGHSGAIRSASFDSACRMIITASDDGTVRLWDVATGEQRAIIVSTGAARLAVNFRQNRDELAISSGNDVHILSSDGRQQIRALVGHQALVNDIRYSLDGSWIATASDDGTVRVWDANTGEQLHLIRLHPGKGRVLRASFTPEKRHVITLNGNGTCYVLRLSTGA